MRIVRRHTEAIADSVQELADLKLVESASVEIRTHRSTPAFKLYVLNGTDAFFGFYPIVKHDVTIAGTPTAIYDVLGKDSTMFHFTADEDSDTSVGMDYVEQPRGWFESVWTTVAREYAA